MCDTAPSPPPAPDYKAAAQATAQGNLATARIGQYGNMVNQSTPYGTVTYDPRTTAYINTEGTQVSPEQYAALTDKQKQGYSPLEQWTQTVGLSPEQQQLFDQSVRINQGLGNVAEGGVKYVQNAMDNPVKSNIDRKTHV